MKVKVTLVKGFFGLLDTKFFWYGQLMVNMINKVKVISISKSSKGQSHFDVKVMLESNGNVFPFLCQSGLLSECFLLLVQK